MIITPFGLIKIYVDGVALEYEAMVHNYDRPPVKGHPITGCYRICVPVGVHRSIRCEVEINDNTIRNTGASGEHYTDSEFVSGKTILTIGAEDENTFYETVHTVCGIEHLIHAPVPVVVFGVAWVTDYEGSSDCRTWYAADPTLDK